jgi:hypothetical protein
MGNLAMSALPAASAAALEKLLWEAKPSRSLLHSQIAHEVQYLKDTYSVPWDRLFNELRGGKREENKRPFSKGG